jgi:hypothetical protein
MSTAECQQVDGSPHADTMSILVDQQVIGDTVNMSMLEDVNTSVNTVGGIVNSVDATVNTVGVNTVNTADVAVSQTQVEKTLRLAAQRASEAYLAATPVTELLYIINNGISFGSEHERHLTDAARHAKAELHRIKSRCLCCSLGDVIAGVREMDHAIVTARNPDTLLTNDSKQCCNNFCLWMEGNRFFVDQTVVRYLREKRRAMLQLSTVPGAELGALLLATQCCAIADRIWKLQAELMPANNIVELIVFRAKLCADMVLTLTLHRFTLYAACTCVCAYANNNNNRF